jgi:hypothetical protein
MSLGGERCSYDAHCLYMWLALDGGFGWPGDSWIHLNPQSTHGLDRRISQRRPGTENKFCRRICILSDGEDESLVLSNKPYHFALSFCGPFRLS